MKRQDREMLQDTQQKEAEKIMISGLSIDPKKIMILKRTIPGKTDTPKVLITGITPEDKL